MQPAERTAGAGAVAGQSRVCVSLGWWVSGAARLLNFTKAQGFGFLYSSRPGIMGLTPYLYVVLAHMGYGL